MLQAIALRARGALRGAICIALLILLTHLPWLQATASHTSSRGIHLHPSDSVAYRPADTSQHHDSAAVNTLGAESVTGATAPSRPKVGLLLSGGGARGMAHIGVLRMLEEHGIRPDYIAGTSMGAILGALYAIGYNADQLEQMAISQNWRTLLSNDLDLSEVAIDLKNTVDCSQLELVWQRGNFRFPLGLVEGKNLWMFFQTLTWPRADVRHFDSLCIPFRCCAVNIRDGRLMEFSQGSLPLAMRASMAIPGAFTPVRVGDSALYVDGGVTDNFPYNSVKRMGADFVIGSYTGPTPATDSVYYSARDIVTRSSMFAGMVRAFDDMPKCDILVMPPLDGYNVLSFRSVARIIQHGYQEAQQHEAEFAALAQRLGSTPSAPRCDSIDTRRTIYLRDIVVEGSPPHMTDFFRRRLQIETPDTLSATRLGEGLARLYSTRFLEQADLDLDSTGTLHIHTQMRERIRLKLGLNFNNEWGAGLVVRMGILNPFVRAGRLNLNAEIATQPRVKANHYFYFNRQRETLFNLGAYYSSSYLPFYVGDQRIADIWQHLVELEASVGQIIKTNGLVEVGASVQSEWQLPSRSYIYWLGQITGRLDQQELSLFFRSELNTLDRHYYPTRGQRIYLRVNYAFRTGLNSSRLSKPADGGAEVEHEFGKDPRALSGILRYDGYLTLGTPRVVGHLSGAAALNNATKGRFSRFRIGGQDEVQRSEMQDIAFYGMGFRQLSANNALTIRLGLRVRLWREFYTLLKSNYLVHTDRMNDILLTLFDVSNGRLGGAAALGWRTRLGVLEGGVSGNSVDRQPRFYFSLGIPF